jgi:CheY-like chemotaxis protein
MNGFLGMTELLLKTQLNEDQEHFARTAHASARDLLVLINDILDFSKTETGKLRINEMDFSPRRLAHETVDLLAEQANSKGLELILSVDKRIPANLRGDPARLRQVLINLLSNAIKFTHDGYVLLSVKLAGESSTGVTLLFTVEDTGIGIAPEAQERVFEAFFQGDSSTTREYGGTGLGLAISSQLAGLMGGGLTLDSELGKGSTFSLTVELEKSNSESNRPTREIEDLSRPTKKAAPGRTGIKPDGSKKESHPLPNEERTIPAARVLLAEDNPVNQAVAKEMLKQFGCQVMAVDNGRSALACIADDSYDLVFMDCQMPEMDGYLATQLIRTLPDQVELPVIAVTAHVMTDDREKCLAAGMNDYLGKPFSSEELKAKLVNWLGRKRGTGKSKRSPVARIAPGKLASHKEKAPGSRKTVSSEVLDGIRALDPNNSNETLETVLNLYLESTQGLLSQIEQAIEEEDCGNLWKSAHSLKSASGNVGAEELSRLCRELEAMGRAKAPAEASAMYSQIKIEYQAVKESLRGELERIAS